MPERNSTISLNRSRETPVRDVSVDILTGPKAGAPERKERLPGAPRLFKSSVGAAGYARNDDRFQRGDECASALS
jgi:hypothetical protein